MICQICLGGSEAARARREGQHPRRAWRCKALCSFLLAYKAPQKVPEEQTQEPCLWLLARDEEAQKDLRDPWVQHRTEQAPGGECAQLRDTPKLRGSATLWERTICHHLGGGQAGGGTTRRNLGPLSQVLGQGVSQGVISRL